jgi:hypothetical protein
MLSVNEAIYIKEYNGTKPKKGWFLSMSFSVLSTG